MTVSSSSTPASVSAAKLEAERIQALFAGYGSEFYGGEAITQTEHALQCAALAEAAGETPAVIVASLLHDVGHLVMAESASEDRRHQDVGARALEGIFGEDVLAPIRLHVPAKRYLCAVDAAYYDTLSQASRDSLALQGGPFTPDELAGFERLPHFDAAVRLRRYDDLAKVVGARTPDLSHYLQLCTRVMRGRA
ncbi:phosphonate degradation HD-domain oxygenase [Achromobacter aloeverae]|uniref:Phosphohydrolase n=1 Tax=Achromobacter aloeverae TaxID=1750518 RepID=A0A4Q1HDU9_9BURK|nr:phosphonate degradation HD-domain oxygenase [Achromobacter aloeverae]RXN83212.1 phosphohydrolase [Achromobacter aloeverae]